MAEPLPTPLRRWALLAALACGLPLLPLVPVWLSTVLLIASAIAFFAQRRWPSWLLFLLMISLGGLVLGAFDFRVGRHTSCAGRCW
jgi:hypothetical protein